MKPLPIKIGVTGTHSTGKTTLVSSLLAALKEHGLKVGRIDNLARRARELGFPILSEHTFESTLWIIAECMRCEAEASLSNDIILVDRAVPDALGYLYAALEVSHRELPPARMESLRAIVRAYVTDYDLIIATTLNPNIPLGDGRDQNVRLRESAAMHIEMIVAEMAPGALRLTSENKQEVCATVMKFVSTRFPKQ